METNPSRRGYFHVSHPRRIGRKCGLVRYWSSFEDRLATLNATLATLLLDSKWMLTADRTSSAGWCRMIQRRVPPIPSLQCGKDDYKAPTQIQRPKLPPPMSGNLRVQTENPQQISTLYEMIFAADITPTVMLGGAYGRFDTIQLFCWDMHWFYRSSGNAIGDFNAILGAYERSVEVPYSLSSDRLSCQRWRPQFATYHTHGAFFTWVDADPRYVQSKLDSPSSLTLVWRFRFRFRTLAKSDSDHHHQSSKL
ncbi:hypothetical protein FNV43_RR14025 [Rhamnella rubrinervis]|uniref:Uncharacterized protein n=1 Tax=Rhamnella rubrinervis TaxID=2594499 RepID=A0A8K0MFX8_9ROSA|nr:hypothetical protein FNV43_RR14025 [Rhamnella rubrinervis]